MWGDARSGSGQLLNPGKRCFLVLAGDVVRTVRKPRYNDSVHFTHTLMERCGMELNYNGMWSPELQQIVALYRGNFNLQLSLKQLTLIWCQNNSVRVTINLVSLTLITQFVV